MNNSFLRGTGVALVTPFNNDNSVDYNSLSKLVNYLIDGGIDYLVVMGTTGESVVLNNEEKAKILSHIQQVNNGRLPIVYGIGGNNTALVVKSIEQQDFKGIDAILSVCPYYNKPTQGGLLAHFAEVAKASPVPVILYNVPGRTGSWLSPESTIELANKFENIVATKEASGKFEEIMKIIVGKPENFMVISGDDGITLPLISIGIEGVISVIGNAAPRLMSTMVNNALNQKYSEAKDIHYKLLPLIELIFKEGNPAGVKAGLNSIGILQNEIRLPLIRASETLYSAIAKQMKNMS